MRKTASKQKTRGVDQGARRSNFSTPKNVVLSSGGDSNGGGCDRNGGGGDPIRKGKGGTPCVAGTKKERKMLWECFGQGGKVKRGGYILRGQRNCMTTSFTK